MCVLVKKKKLVWEIAGKNILVYTMKIVNGKKITSLCNSFDWVLGKKYRADGRVNRAQDYDGIEIREGVFHSSPKLQPLIDSVAEGDWNSFLLLMVNDSKISFVKGYIPKGTKYIQAINHRCSSNLDDKPAYISKYLVLTKVLL